MARSRKRGGNPSMRGRNRPGSTIWTPEFEEAILACLREGASVRDAIEEFGVSRSTIYKRLREDEEWKKRWDEAYDQGNDAIRDEVRRRGMDGVLEPVYHEGTIVGRKRRYSDTLLMFYAKSRMPEFRENQHDHNHTFNLDGVAERFASKIAAIAAARRSRPTAEGDDE